MMLIKLQRKVPAQSDKFNGKEVEEPVRKIQPRVKVMTMMRMLKEVENEARKLALQGVLAAKQGSRVISLIRKEIEETKRKVRESSPSSLQFIGPGDKSATLIERGGIICIGA
jgi:hypothetical protein